MAIMNQVKELEDGTVTVPLFTQSTVDNLQTAQDNTEAYHELMKGFKADSLSASPLGPM